MTPMDLIHAIVLAVVQGLTEFLPISSSGHLILVPYVFGWPDQGLAFDVAVHLGTLIAVIANFRAQLVAITRGWIRSLAGGELTPDARLAWCVALGSVPVGLAGLLFGRMIEESFRDPLFVAGTLSLFGALMWLADRYGRSGRDEYHIGWRDALAVGAAQALSLMAGTSRSGVTMMMSRTLGLSRDASARFSFLLAVPGIAMAGGWELVQLARNGGNGADWQAMGLGLVVSAVTGYVCIRWLLQVINRIGLGPFAVYRLALAAAIVLVFA